MESTEIPTYSDYHETAERIIWAAVLTFGAIVGTIGNCLVIFASLRFGTFKVCGVTVIFIRNIAMSDLLFTITYFLPIGITHIGGGWVLGDILCKITGKFVTIPAFASINFILAISVHRYLRCKYPHSTAVTKLDITKANYLSMAIWSFSCIFLIYTFIIKMKARFLPKLAACSFVYDINTANLVVISVLTLVPFVIITVINIVLWVYVTSYLKEHGKGHDLTTALITTAAVTGLFWVMWIPTIVRFHLSAVKGESFISESMEKLRYLYFLGACLNPVIYTMVNKGFRDFLYSILKRNWDVVHNRVISSPESVSANP